LNVGANFVLLSDLKFISIIIVGLSICIKFLKKLGIFSDLKMNRRELRCFSRFFYCVRRNARVKKKLS
jgi:hypothetical protein